MCGACDGVPIHSRRSEATWLAAARRAGKTTIAVNGASLTIGGSFYF